MITFDQRGTGTSGPLRCNALTAPPPDVTSRAGLYGACAAEIGSTARFYSTADSVADIEAIRQAAGYQKLVLFGVSYGTWVAMQYTRAPIPRTWPVWCSTRRWARTAPTPT